jgi:hypothetical protein
LEEGVALKMIQLSDKWAIATAAVAGAATWIGISQLSGRQEAWDSELYFTFALPGLWLGCFALGFFAAVKAWRWGFVAFIAQALVMIVQKPGGSLLPLGLILFAIFGAIGALPAEIGAGLRRWAERFVHRGGKA